MAEVAHLVTLAKHSLQLSRVAVRFTIRYAVAVSDTIAHTSHFDRLRSPSCKGKEAQYN